MGAVYLLDLDDWLAEEFDDDEFSFEPGWMTRHRSTGGYERVLAIGTHHTAGGGSAAGQVSHAVNANDAPIGAIHLYANGHIRVIAAGATNTQGKGGPLHCSRGTIPLNQGNLYMVSIEAHNDGIGGVWPEVQLRNYLRLVRLLCRKLGLDPARDVYGHAGYCEPSCPGRKIDPAGPTPSMPSLGGTSAPPAWTWDDDEFRRLVIGLGDPDPGPAPGPAPGRVPNPPRTAQLSKPRSGTVTASWSAPDDPGTSDVFEYFLQVETKAKSGQWVDAGTTQGDVLSADVAVANNTEARVRVLARNSTGASGWTTSSYLATHRQTSPPPTAPPPAPAPGAGVAVYTVVSGDSWWGISRKLGVDMGELVVVNRTNTRATIFAGQTLAVPGRSFKVLAGEGWWAVARGVGVPLDEVLDANDATVDTPLQPNQIVATARACPLPASTLSEGSRGDAVEQLQTWLKSYEPGWYDATVDGVYGPATRQAVRWLQERMKTWTSDLYQATVDGQYGRRTIEDGCTFIARLGV
ncbi:LysM peptidoglycan-binding domain-containing protein [Desertimonas flava]|uniref:LysM peptidoglycan-binding domain-containing protein n=1 Tax=Desertimonas flava TaxID=2064846 RepID=UPI000E349FBC|nr:LysM peptidoglycan-binding domain-containing protein [Desertimonas flava]